MTLFRRMLWIFLIAVFLLAGLVFSKTSYIHSQLTIVGSPNANGTTRKKEIVSSGFHFLSNDYLDNEQEEELEKGLDSFLDVIFKEEGNLFRSGATRVASIDVDGTGAVEIQNNAEQATYRIKDSISPDDIQFVVGSGVWEEERRSLAGRISGIQFNGVGDVNIVKDDTATVTIMGDNNLLALIRTQVIDGLLHIGVIPGKSFSCKTPPRLEVRLPALAHIQQNGGGHITASGFNGDSLSIVSSGIGNIQVTGSFEQTNIKQQGSGTIDARFIQANSWDIQQTGHGLLKLDGSAKRALIKSDGKTYFQAKNWDVEHLTVFAADNAVLRLGTINEISYDISDASTLIYSGNPVVKQITITVPDVLERQ